jgi:hypothetical protein
MKLASETWVTKEEVEKTFGVKLRLSHKNGSNENVYVAENASFRYGDDFKFLQNESAQRWALALSGFTEPFLAKDKSCIPYGRSMDRILSMGWKEEQTGLEVIEYRYVKKVGRMGSVLYVEQGKEASGVTCLYSIQFENVFLRPASR